MRKGSLVLWAAVSACACNVDKPITPSQPPAAAQPAQPTPNAVVSTWSSNAIVQSSYGNGACGTGIQQGEMLQDVNWQMTITGSQIVMIQDPHDFPMDDPTFAGAVTGDSFDASENLVNLNLAPTRPSCDFRRSDITGQFSANQTHFEAVEIGRAHV